MGCVGCLKVNRAGERRRQKRCRVAEGDEWIAAVNGKS